MIRCCVRDCQFEGEKKIAGKLRCFFHSKVLGAIITSQRRGLKTPSFRELEILFLSNLKCESCSVIFNYHVDPKTEKKKNRASLQHNKNGTYSVFCVSCNSIDGNHTLGSNFIKLEGKFCPRCEQDLPWEEFYLKGTRSRGSGYCIKCTAEDCKERYYAKR